MQRNPQQVIIGDVYHDSSNTSGANQTHTVFEDKLGLLLPDPTWNSSSPHFLDLLYTKQVVAIPKSYIAPLNIAIGHVDITAEQLAASLHATCQSIGVEMFKLTGFRIEKPPDAYYILAVTLMVAAATGQTNTITRQVVEKCAGVLVSKDVVQGIPRALEDRQTPNNGGNEPPRKTNRPKVQIEARFELQQATGIAMLHKQREIARKLELQQEKMVAMSDYNDHLATEATNLGLGPALANRRQFLQAQKNVNYLAPTRPQPREIDATKMLKDFINNMGYKSFLIRILKLNFPSDELLKINIRLLKEHEKTVMKRIANDASQNALKLGFGKVSLEHLNGLFRAEDQIQLSQERHFAVNLRDVIFELESLDLHRIPEYVSYCRDNQKDVRLGNTIMGSERAEIEFNRITEELIHTLVAARENEMMEVLQNPNYAPQDGLPLYRRGENPEVELPAPQPAPIGVLPVVVQQPAPNPVNANQNNPNAEPNNPEVLVGNNDGMPQNQPNINAGDQNENIVQQAVVPEANANQQ